MKRNCLSLMIGALLATGPVLAQESPTAGRSASPTNLDSIKVTARKREAVTYTHLRAHET